MSNSNIHTDQEELIVRYLTGNASATETQQLEKWVKADKKNKKQFLEYKHSWQFMHSTNVTFDTKKAWGSIENSLLAEEDAPKVISIHEKKTNRYVIYRLAASVVVLMSLAIVLYFLLNRSGEVELMAADTIISEELIDGSEITLNINSTLTVLKDFNVKHRQVKLAGDAFFDIIPDKEKPFIINTDELNIKVLGTSFYVNSREKASIVEVMVKSGHVSVSRGNNEYITLTAGEKGTFDKNTGLLVAAVNSDKNYLAWKTKKLVFENRPLAEVIVAVSKTYDVEIRLANQSLSDCRLTSTYEDYSLEDVLILISETLNLKVSGSGDLFYLDGEGCD